MAEDWVDLAFQAAVDFLREKKPTPDDVFDTLSVEAADKAFTVARLSKLELLQGVLDDLSKAAAEGMTLDEFLAKNQDLGLTDAHLETVYRTNLQSAFGKGRYGQLTDPLISAGIWGWRYKTVHDDRVRESHAALDGLTFQTGAHDEIFPPWGFNCRCSSEPVTAREARVREIQSDELPAASQEEVGTTQFASPAIAAGRELANLGRYDLGLISHFVNDQATKGGMQ